ncbi:MAG: DUF86 domain-containing protein, partial [Coleofasciculus sp. S288]|nr:DUF86 domain-containing protein [Coleofasciculus sp. S288]
MTRTLREYLQDILDYVNTIENLVSGMSFEEVTRDKKTLLAVMMAFTIIGEATKGIPQSFRNQYPHVPWKSMAGMRDKVVHEYFQADLDVLWQTIQNDIPQSKYLIEECHF